MMAKTRTTTAMSRNSRTFPVRVLSVSLPVIVILPALLWLTEYPADEWPFVSAAFMMCFAGAGTLVSAIAILTLKRVQKYANGAVLRLETVIDENVDAATIRAVRFFTMATMLVIGLTAWGLAFYTLTVVMTQLGMEPIAEHLQLVTLILFVSCSASFMLFFGLLAWLFRLVERDPQTIRRLPKRFRGWMNDVSLVRPPVLPGMPAVVD